MAWLFLTVSLIAGHTNSHLYYPIGEFDSLNNCRSAISKHFESGVYTQLIHSTLRQQEQFLRKVDGEYPSEFYIKLDCKPTENGGGG